MRVDRITLTNYRNIAALEIVPGKKTNIICADNGQGKTNLLESIWIFCGAKSFRGGKDSDCISVSAQHAVCEMNFFSGDRHQSAKLQYPRQARKKIFLNEIPLKKASELAEAFKCVVFSPDHLLVVKQGPEKRRELLDAGLSQIYPKYRKNLDNYERILRQRTFLLRDARNHNQLLDTLDTWDFHMAEYGAYITFMRNRYVNRLAAACAPIYNGISRGKESLGIHYHSGFLNPEQNNLLADRTRCSEQLLQLLKDTRQDDLRAGFTTVGPHRDDLILEINGLNARAFASQGQQRSCVLALKLAECQLLTDVAGEPPVVLLDDVMSELDKGRREYLLNHLDAQQVFITCCDTASFEGIEGGEIFFMKQGSLVEALDEGEVCTSIWEKKQ